MSYKVVPAELAAAQADVLYTWKDGFPEHTGERFEWMYRRNPAGDASVWLAHAEGVARPIGSTALVRREFSLNGRRMTGGISADFTVHSEHRGFGPALALQRQAAAAADAGEVDFVYGTPNRQAAPLVRRAGYRTIGGVVQLTRLLRTRTAIQRKVGNAAATWALALVADTGLALFSALRFPDRGRRFVASAVERFDERFDRLWLAASKERPLLGDRSARFLQWRFGDAPGAPFQVFCITDRRTGELGGYVVYTTNQGRTDIADMLCVNLHGPLRALLAQFVAARRRAGDEAISINFFGEPRLLAALKRHGFSVRDSSDPVMVYTPPGMPDAETLHEAGSWWFFRADNDV